MSAAPHKKLGQFAATAIAGNDILSSCLYVTGIGILFAGIYAPVVFVGIALVLWLYKHIYTEVVEALPLNGGAYNCLLNATTKNVAAVAGVMTALSYVATSVISAKTAVEYLHTIVHGIPVLPFTTVVIVGFALLTIAGVRDSAKVAQTIFVFHAFVLILFVSLGLLAIVNTGWGFFASNLAASTQLFAAEGLMKMLFLAFAASLLGVSGFESSANFVEEQQPGVFRKTLRNMLLGVAVFNPLISLVLLTSLPMEAIAASKDFVLAESALEIGGRGLQYLVVVDAFLVLSGAVLASFVGATGLLYRMTLDHCFPSNILLPKLRQRNANATRIVIAFAALCLSILFVTKGELLSLAGVYTMSFLGVMTAFALGNLILRRTRADLKRTYTTPVAISILAALATTAGIIGNVLIDARNLAYFALYFVPVVSIVMAMIYRDYILEAALRVVAPFPLLARRIEPWLQHVTRPRVILFARHPEKLYRSLEYIRTNETSRNILVVFAAPGVTSAREVSKRFESFIAFFREARVFPQLKIDFVMESEAAFGPDAVKRYASLYRTPRNNIFIGTLHQSHEFSFEELGGVRIIQ